MKYEVLIFGSKHPTVLITDHYPVFQLILIKIAKIHIDWTAGENLA